MREKFFFFTKKRKNLFFIVLKFAQLSFHINWSFCPVVWIFLILKWKALIYTIIIIWLFLLYLWYLNFCCLWKSKVLAELSLANLKLLYFAWYVFYCIQEWTYFFPTQIHKSQMLLFIPVPSSKNNIKRTELIWKLCCVIYWWFLYNIGRRFLIYFMI